MEVFESIDPHPYPMRNSGFRNFRKQLHRWSLQGGGQFVKTLSRLSLKFTDTCAQCEGPCDTIFGLPTEFELDFIFSPEQGLTVQQCGSDDPLEEDECLDSKMMDAVRRAVADLEAERRLNGVAGEILITLVVDRLPQWDFLIPKTVRDLWERN
jgi:hypothetical protein